MAVVQPRLRNVYANPLYSIFLYFHHGTRTHAVAMDAVPLIDAHTAAILGSVNKFAIQQHVKWIDNCIGTRLRFVNLPPAASYRGIVVTSCHRAIVACARGGCVFDRKEDARPPPTAVTPHSRSPFLFRSLTRRPVPHPPTTPPVLPHRATQHVHDLQPGDTSAFDSRAGTVRVFTKTVLFPQPRRGFAVQRA